MVRNPIKQEEPQAPTPEAPKAPAEAEAPKVPTQFVEREINLSLINDKLNYVTGLLHKIAEAAEIDLKD